MVIIYTTVLTILYNTLLEDNSLSNQSSTTFSCEYNEASYVINQFYNGSLSVTYTLKKVN